VGSAEQVVSARRQYWDDVAARIALAADRSGALPQLDGAELDAHMQRRTGVPTVQPDESRRATAEAIRKLADDVCTTDTAAVGVVEVADDSRPSKPRSARSRAYDMERHPIVGAANPIAPPLTLQLRGALARAIGAFREAHAGLPGYVYGGELAAAFDVVLGLASAASGVTGLSAEMTVRFIAPVKVGEPILIEAIADFTEDETIRSCARLTQHGALCALATAEYATVDTRLFSAPPQIEEREVLHGASTTRP